MTGYRTMLQRQAVDTARRKLADPVFKKDAATQRGTLSKLRALGDALTKEQLKGDGEAALKRLRELFTISLDELAKVQPALLKAGQNAALATRVRALTKQKTVLKTRNGYSESDLKQDEKRAISSVFFSNQQFERVMEANAKQAALKTVPQDEADGVRDLNELRMLVGLSPVLIDPKLHLASRDHSKDMVNHKFFAHDSPVKGRDALGPGEARRHQRERGKYLDGEQYGSRGKPWLVPESRAPREYVRKSSTGRARPA